MQPNIDYKNPYILVDVDLIDNPQMKDNYYYLKGLIYGMYELGRFERRQKYFPSNYVFVKDENPRRIADDSSIATYTQLKNNLYIKNPNYKKSFWGGKKKSITRRKKSKRMKTKRTKRRK
jgi:hypothetical protein